MNIDIKSDMDKSKLFQLINSGSPSAYKEALALLDIVSPTEVRYREKGTQNTLLHVLIQRLSKLYRRARGDISTAISLCYKLALRGCDVNAQNVVGNTALHMACFRPHGDKLSQHLIRLGVDPGIMNENGCRVIHHNAEHKCWLVKGQRSAKCSIWTAVAREDKAMIEGYLRSWCRVNTKRKRKTLMDVAYETGSYRIVEQLLRHRRTNELVVACLAGHIPTINQLLSSKSDKCDLQTVDCSQRIPKPLLAEVVALLPISKPAADILRKHGFSSETLYLERLNDLENEFESTRFYNLVASASLEDLRQAWTEIDEQKFYVNAVRSDGSSYLHFLVERYLELDDVSCKRAIIRLMYKLALAKIDVQIRNNRGETALVTAYTEVPDRILLDHLIQLGVDSSIRANDGQCVAVNTYATRGELLLQRQTNRRYLPGLWVAVEDKDPERVQHWLSSLCRVNTSKGGRTLLELSRNLESEEVTKLLEEHLHITEFVVASLAGDIKTMKHYIAMGNGLKKVNACFMHHFAGFTDDWKAEFVVRPLIVNVMEYCPAEAASYLIHFGARLDVHYEECAPCAPVAFWALRDDIHDDVSQAIASTANMELRDEMGATLLHRAILRRSSTDAKLKLIETMLERGANVSARDIEGLTARDYCDQEDVIGADALRQLIDDFVLNLCYVGDYDAVEQLIIEGYDHITDIRGTIRHKTAKELAFLRYYKELLELLDEIPRYQKEISDLHKCVIRNEMKGVTRLASEKKVAWGIDKRGRNILHLAVLYRHHEIVESICEQFPQLIEHSDNLDRTPPHYAVSLRDQRATLSIISMNNTIDMNRRDANNLSVLDYSEQVERPIPVKSKPRGRRIRNYQVKDMIQTELEATKSMEDDRREQEDLILRTMKSEIRPRTAMT